MLKNDSEIAVREGTSTLILSDKTISKKAMIPMILAVGAVNSHGKKG